MLEMATNVRIEVHVHPCFLVIKSVGLFRCFFNIKFVCPLYGPQKFQNSAISWRKSVRHKPPPQNPYSLKNYCQILKMNAMGYTTYVNL